MPSDTKGSVTLKNGRAVVTIGTMKQPGFRDCRLQATIAGKTYKHHVKVGFSPDKLQPYTKMPADFDEFWDKSKSEIATFPLLYTKERVEKYSTDKIDCYLVKLQLNNRGQSIYGYLTCPRNMQKGAYLRSGRRRAYSRHTGYWRRFCSAHCSDILLSVERGNFAA